MKTTKATKMVLCGAAVALLGMVFVACGTRAPARPAADELVSVPVVGDGIILTMRTTMGRLLLK